MTTASCAHCGQPFEPTQVTSKYCSAGCRTRVNRNKAREKVKAARRAAHEAKQFVCAHCGDEFHPAFGRGYRWKYCSPTCERASNEIRNHRHVWSRYRLSKAEYDQLVEAQANRCAICGDEMNGTVRDPDAPQIDHDHVSGRVRGILCRRCNTGLGQFRDDASIIERALRYLAS